MRPQEAILASMSRPRTVDGDRVADPDAEGAGELGIERDELRPAIVRRPPLPGDEARASGWVAE
jgi:hypothetical protein